MYDALQTWEAVFPNYNFFFHDDSAVDTFLADTDWTPDFPLLRTALKCVQKGAMKVDIWRVLILWKYGGFYSDADVVPFAQRVTEDLIDNKVSFFSFSDTYHRTSQWSFAMSPGHFIGNATMFEIVKNILELENIAFPQLVFTTGPFPLWLGFRKFLNWNETVTHNRDEYVAAGVTGETVKKVGGKTRLYIDYGYWKKPVPMADSDSDANSTTPPFNKLVTRKERMNNHYNHTHWKQARYVDQEFPKRTCQQHLEILAKQQPIIAMAVASSHSGVPVRDGTLLRSLRRTPHKDWSFEQQSSTDIDPRVAGFECKWADFQASASGKTMKVCVHPFPDGVSNQILKKHRFHHCNILPTMWNDPKLAKTDKSIYLEIGANIGSCIWEMLLSTNAKIIAFEPHPNNVFAIRSTLQNLESELRDRVVLLPVALGSESAVNKIYAAEGNMGNSVVGKAIHDKGKANQGFNEERVFNITIERLDSIVSPYPDIPLAKMDAQGFECNIIGGIGQDLANQIQKIKFEVSQNHLPKQNCHDLLERFRNLGFQIYRENGNEEIQGEYQQFNRLIDLVASKSL